MQNPVPDERHDVAARVARRTLANRGHDYTAEVRRLLDAGREVMRRCGTETRPRVADIVAEAGLSNDAFYRHFASKDALVGAILDDGAERLRSYLTHQMAKETDPDEQVRRWVTGVLGQARDAIGAATTLAVLWNAGTVPDGSSGPEAILAPLLEKPFVDLGSDDAALDASLVAHAVIGRLSDHLRAGSRPTRSEIARITGFCLAAVTRRS